MSIKVSEYQLLNNKLKNETSQVKNAEQASVDSEVIQTNTIPSGLLKGAYGVVPFNAQASKTNSRTVPFTANPLYDINLKKLIQNDEYKLIPAKFSELILKNEDDNWAMADLNDLWSKIGETNYTKVFTREFLAEDDKKAYFVTELIDDKKDLFNRVTCLLQTTNPKNDLQRDIMEVKLVQSSPQIVGKTAPPIKGSGALALYGAVKVAKENGYKTVQLYSTNNSFYEGMGLKKIRTEFLYKEYPNSGGVYELDASMYDSFLKKIADKYELK